MRDFISLQAEFTPDPKAFADTPEQGRELVAQSYRLLAQIIGKIIRENYMLGDLDLSLLPVSKERMVMRISRSDQDIKQPNEIGFSEDMIDRFITDLDKASEVTDEIYAGRNDNGYHVLSFGIEGMVSALSNITNQLPQAKEYNEALGIVLFLKRKLNSDRSGCKIC